MPPTNIAALLKKGAANWTEAKEEQKRMFGADDLPDLLTCRAQLSKAEFKEKDGKVRLNRGFTIVDGDHAGVSVFDGFNMDSSMGMAWARQWIEQHGYECPEDVGDLPEYVEAIEKSEPIYQVQIKRSGDFLNVRVLSVEEAGEGSETAEGEAKAGAEAEAEGEVEKTEDELAEEALVERMNAFCVGNGIEVESDDTSETLKEKMDGYTYEQKDLSEEEIALLTELGLEERINKPVVAKAAPKAAPKPAPKAAPAAPAKAPAKAPLKKK